VHRFLPFCSGLLPAALFRQHHAPLARGLGRRYGSGLAGGGSNLSRMRRSARMRGDSGKRSVEIVAFSSATSAGFSASERSSGVALSGGTRCNGRDAFNDITETEEHPGIPCGPEIMRPAAGRVDLLSPP
jgi:hypothetical protein